MESSGISKDLIQKIRALYKETRSAVRIDEKLSEWFVTNKRVRQGCPLSPLLFALMVTDLNKKLNRELARGIKLGSEDADICNLVVLARSKEELKRLIKRFGRFK